MNTTSIKSAVELHKAGKLTEAEKIYRQILQQEPENHNALHLLGVILGQKGNPGEAVDYLEKAILLHPIESSFFHNAAGIYRTLGDLEKAEAYFRKAIELKPSYGEAYQGLTELMKLASDDPLIDQILTQFQQKQTDKNKSYLHFSAGKFYDDNEEFDKAFWHFRLGNQLAGITCDMEKYEQMAKDIIYLYSRAYKDRRRDCGVSAEQPVFIVGMPRSGTTLVEQILSSHPEVFGAGELAEINDITVDMAAHNESRLAYPECIKTLADEKLAGYAEGYLRRINGLVAGKPYQRIIDKQPINFFHVGLIHDMFPKARFIHTHRNPKDICLSCYFQNFSNGADFSFDLTHLGMFYRIYQRLMEHWQQLLPDSIFNLGYEDLIDNQKANSEALLEFCGLEWNEECLNFHKSKRSVRTASFWQVRQPLYKSAIGRHQRYSIHIGQLDAALDSS